MIHPLTSFPLQGVIWYQGKSNLESSDEYADLFMSLIADWRDKWQKEEFIPPCDTMTGALARYISDGSVKDFQPMGASFGLLPGLETKIRDKRQRYEALADRGLNSLKNQIAKD